MTREEIYDRLQKKYFDAVLRLNDRPWDTIAKTERRYALNDLMVFVRSLVQSMPVREDDVAF